MATNKEIIALVQAGDLEGAAAAIKAILNQKKDNLVSEATVFMASSIFEAKACNEGDGEDEDGDGEQEAADDEDNKGSDENKE